MQRRNMIMVSTFMNIIISYGLIIFMCSGCGFSVHQQQREDLTLSQASYLYDDLIMNHPDCKNSPFPYRGIIKFYKHGHAIWLVWMTEGGLACEGIIGAYDANLKLLDVRISRTIINITKAELSGDIDVLLLKEISKSGTGIYGERLLILNPDDLKHSLWSGEIKSWEEGLSGRNEGHLLHAVVMLLDVNNDEKKELVVIKSKQMGTYDDKNILYGNRKVECSKKLE